MADGSARLDTCGLGQDQVAGNSKQGNKTSDSILFFWGRRTF